MDTRHFANPSQPAPLFHAQVALYMWAVYSAIRDVLDWLGGGATGTILTLVLFTSFFAIAAGYAISNEFKLGYRLAMVVAAAGLIPLLDELARRPSALLHLDYLVLAALPAAIVVWLMHPASRDYQRVWFH
jgi:hypothetical protein